MQCCKRYAIVSNIYGLTRVDVEAMASLGLNLNHGARPQRYALPWINTNIMKVCFFIDKHYTGKYENQH